MILIDSRIGSKDLADLIDNAILVELEYGDASFTGHGPNGDVEIGVEVKRINDLVNSIASGRLSGHQIPGLLSSYHRVYLIVQDTWRSNPISGIVELPRRGGWRELPTGKRQWRGADIWAYLNTLQVFCGVIVRMSSNLGETAKIIEQLYAWWQKPWEKHRGHLQRHKPDIGFLTPEKLSLVCRIAMELPGVGLEKAFAIDKRFKSVEEMVSAKIEDWLTIEGIGKTIALNVHQAIRGKLCI